MVYFHNSISLCNSTMANSICSSDSGSKSRPNNSSNHLNRNRRVPISSSSSSANSLQIPPCDRSRLAIVDVVIFIAVISAILYLFFPYIELVIITSIRVSKVVFCVMKEEFSVAPSIYIAIVMSIVCAALATWGVVACTSRKCGNPNCKGLRKAAEFDIQLETEDCVKNSGSVSKDGGGGGGAGAAGIKKGLFELPRDHHRELEAELKKMAPINGRAVLVLRARCGCSVGRLEVPGPKKHPRKIKK
ncbi:hypothetical protein HN51_060014 [Arachis hypogaea]|uniref:ZP domain-containing protein n=4 Tax=Arachis TaxID=3817 RepID=A0A444X858_ARAHY|nr:uncharacterized protein At5g19025 [Arachis duranensis]XP_016181829.1 uncharacterized protein At5g19025 [Arachis ipaensis]XP_025624091.1 uncharacterized protein At5g19025 [Arachis hypogaea]XP_025681858.1 uncharacterized protein At5g19025 [Arachis hypogaea]XP_057739355.1 uncharacterized protein At5g19025 [Arachis stenosperma]QHN83558.1 uncharacterized protein DS421_20g705780 [Arachis hypogaea]QHO17166.1 uncharacterized protein DS421_10g309850 [Arachis hypogaea]RYQ85880.1 hypothetical protei